MASSPSYGERPPLQGFRRSFTTAHRRLSHHERAGLDPSDAAANILYSHPSARIVKFTPSTASIPASTALIPPDTDYPVDTVETLPWASTTETTIASGVLIIEKVQGSTNFLKSGDIMHAILRNSQCWCVDGVSKFVLRVRKFQYYRIELPTSTTQETEKVEELKTVLGKILRFEITPCPFKRGFHVDLPESAITPRRKGQWKRREGSLPSTPLSGSLRASSGKSLRTWSRRATSDGRIGSQDPDVHADLSHSDSPLVRKPHTNGSYLGDARSTTPSSLASNEDFAESDEPEQESDQTLSDQDENHQEHPEFTPVTDEELTGLEHEHSDPELVRDEANTADQPRHLGDEPPKNDKQPLIDLRRSLAHEVILENPLEIEDVDEQVTKVDEPIVEADKQVMEVDEHNMEEDEHLSQVDDLEDHVPEPAERILGSPNLEEHSSNDVQRKEQGEPITYEDEPDKLEALIQEPPIEEQLNKSKPQEPAADEDLDEFELPVQNAAVEEYMSTFGSHKQEPTIEGTSSESHVDLETVPSPDVDDSMVDGYMQPLSMSASRSDDVLSKVSSVDSFHTLASSPEQSPVLPVSRMFDDDRTPMVEHYDPLGMSTRQHKREISEMTVTPLSPRSAEEEYASPGSPTSDRPSTPPLIQSSLSESSWAEIGTPSSPSIQQGLRHRLKTRRSLSPLPPSSTIFSPPSQQSQGNHLTAAILQKACTMALVKPIEVMVLLVHILARIAGGATVNDLMSGELFKRPEHGRDHRRNSSLPDQIDTRKDDATDEDDFGIPIRGRLRSTDMGTQNDETDSLLDLD